MKRARLAQGALAVAVAGALAVWLLGPSLARTARDLDLLGLLRRIGHTNAEIGQANAGILTAMGNVRLQIEGVDRVRARLSTMEKLLAQQQAEMEELRRIMAQQVALSRQLKELTARVEPASAGLAQTAAAEAGALESMRDTTAQLAGKLRTIGAVNHRTAGKLDQAEKLSAIVLSRMP